MSKAPLVLALVALASAASVRPSAGQPGPKPMPTADFVKAAAGSDQYEILAAEVATIEGRNPRVRAYAQQMIQDHSRTSQALRQAALSAGLGPPPPGLGDDGARMLSQLQSLKGQDFDRAYVKQQVLAHHQALVVEQGYARSGSDVAVRQAAQSAGPIIQHHLEMAGQMMVGGS